MSDRVDSSWTSLNLEGKIESRRRGRICFVQKRRYSALLKQSCSVKGYPLMTVDRYDESTVWHIAVRILQEITNKEAEVQWWSQTEFWICFVV